MLKLTRLQPTSSTPARFRILSGCGDLGRASSLLALLLMCVGLTACGNPIDTDLNRAPGSSQVISLRQPGDLKPLPLRAGQPLKVVASTSIIADVAANVGGEALELTVLIPRGVDPHAYQPTPGDLQALYQADLVLLNGFGLEVALEDELGAVSTSVAVVSLSDGLEPRTLAQEPGPSGGDSEQGEGLDPHVWFDPTMVSHWVDRIETALAQLNPDHAAEFHVNASRYRSELESLDGWIRDQLISIPGGRRKLVLDHLVLGYFADRYDFEVVSALVPAFSSAAETSAHELALLDTTIRSEGLPVIFIGMDTNPRLAEQLAGDLGIEVVQLYTGSLSRAGGPANTYIEMMQYNVLAMQRVLGQE